MHGSARTASGDTEPPAGRQTAPTHHPPHTHPKEHLMTIRRTLVTALAAAALVAPAAQAQPADMHASTASGRREGQPAAQAGPAHARRA